MLSGDHVMGWNSTLVAVPDGSMADYLASLRKVIELPYSRYIPSHGGEIADGPGYARALLAHRELRNRQVIEAVNGGVRSVADAAHRGRTDAQGPYRVSRDIRRNRRQARAVPAPAAAGLVVGGRCRGGIAQHQGHLIVEVEEECLDAGAVLAEIGEARERGRAHGDGGAVAAADDTNGHLLAEAEQRRDHGVELAAVELILRFAARSDVPAAIIEHGRDGVEHLRRRDRVASRPGIGEARFDLGGIPVNGQSLVVVGVTVGLIALVCDIALRTMNLGRMRSSDRKGSSGGGILIVVLLVVAILAPIAAKAVQMAVSRQREYLADATSVQFTRNPNGLISALGKLAEKAAPFPGVSRATQHLFIVNPINHAGLAAAFDLQGHRGARGLAPENTLAGFKVAQDLGVT
eukprot:gene41433-54924_t